MSLKQAINCIDDLLSELRDCGQCENIQAIAVEALQALSGAAKSHDAMKANYAMRQGICPMCNCEIDEFEETQCAGDRDIRPYTCKACAFQGREVLRYAYTEGANEKTGEWEIVKGERA